MKSRLSGYLADLSGSDEAQAEAAAIALAGYPPLQVLPRLRRLLTSSDPDTRWWALRTLASISDPQVPGLLVRSLEDPYPLVRQGAALGLRDHPDPQAVPGLAKALADADHLVVMLAAGALAAIGKPAVPALLEVLYAGSRASQVEAVRALAAIGDPQSIPALFGVLDEDSAMMEYWAAQGLERMGVGMVFFNPR